MRLLTGVLGVQDAASVGLAAMFCSDACVRTSSTYNSVVFWEYNTDLLVAGYRRLV
jgi:hypothetical protein